ncbi:MAG: YkgJ family cysteine cluster protein [Gammaproteobacteria bacterium]|nr:YkgJ family cysteine cluster protein [Gammaproteobacteria bacterium]MDH5652027.1 YkgJ family cysteine cluster protein [Gammaproteobacteria bacterium]
MPRHKKRVSSQRSIQTVLDQYQRQVIIPHCHRCTKPCCSLNEVVLEFDWKQLQDFYQLETGQNAFDRSLKNGTGPHWIRKKNDLYYAHGSPCPAYDTASRRCSYYQSRLKPQNCSDFPVYLDNETIVLDSRCEAAGVENLISALQEKFPARVFTCRRSARLPVLLYIESKH